MIPLGVCRNIRCQCGTIALSVVRLLSGDTLVVVTEKHHGFKHSTPVARLPT